MCVKTKINVFFQRQMRAIVDVRRKGGKRKRRFNKFVPKLLHRMYFMIVLNIYIYIIRLSEVCEITNQSLRLNWCASRRSHPAEEQGKNL